MNNYITRISGNFEYGGEPLEIEINAKDGTIKIGCEEKSITEWSNWATETRLEKRDGLKYSIFMDIFCLAEKKHEQFTLESKKDETLDEKREYWLKARLGKLAYDEYLRLDESKPKSKFEIGQGVISEYGTIWGRVINRRACDQSEGWQYKVGCNDDWIHESNLTYYCPAEDKSTKQYGSEAILHCGAALKAIKHVIELLETVNEKAKKIKSL